MAVDHDDQMAAPHPLSRHRTFHDNQEAHDRRVRNVRCSRVPVTANDLRSYHSFVADSSIHVWHGDGRVNPSHYGSVLECDLGLCYNTFKTRHPCEHGTRCPWRHHPLTAQEKDWIRLLGRDMFVVEAERHCVLPGMAEPSYPLGRYLMECSDARDRRNVPNESGSLGRSQRTRSRSPRRDR
jgi:hypothetical protein